jgi:hypothetical protein
MNRYNLNWRLIQTPYNRLLALRLGWIRLKQSESLQQVYLAG